MRNITTNSIFSIPRDKRYFEDYLPGSIYEFGSIVVERDELINFTQRYDPHGVDSGLRAVREARNGGIVATGLQTVAMGMRLFVDSYISQVACIGSPDVDNLRWPKPVFPGDELSIRVTIMGRKRSRPESGQGIVRSFVEVLNQNREVVASWRITNILLCRRR